MNDTIDSFINTMADLVGPLLLGAGICAAMLVLIFLIAVMSGSVRGFVRAARQVWRVDGPSIRRALLRTAASWGEPRNGRRIALVAVLFVTLAWNIGAERSLYITSIVLIVMAWRYDPAHPVDTIAGDHATTKETKHP